MCMVSNGPRPCIVAIDVPIPKHIIMHHVYQCRYLGLKIRNCSTHYTMYSTILEYTRRSYLVHKVCMFSTSTYTVEESTVFGRPSIYRLGHWQISKIFWWTSHSLVLNICMYVRSYSRRYNFVPKSSLHSPNNKIERCIFPCIAHGQRSQFTSLENEKK